MTNVLIVTAGKFRDPVALVVLMEAGDLLVHGSEYRGIPLRRPSPNDELSLGPVLQEHMQDQIAEPLVATHP